MNPVGIFAGIAAASRYKTGILAMREVRMRLIATMLAVWMRIIRPQCKVANLGSLGVGIRATSASAFPLVPSISSMREVRMLCADFGPWHVLESVPADYPILSFSNRRVYRYRFRCGA